MSPLQSVIPEYKPKDSRLDSNVAVADFLSHRTGLSGDMSIGMQGDLEFLLPPSELVTAVSDLDTVAPLRRQYMYNNWGYSVAGGIIERLSQKPFHEYLREALLDPLNLTNTTSRPVLDDSADFAEAYTALRDSRFYPLPRALPFKKSIFESAGGIYSTVNDLLNKQIPFDNSKDDSPFYGFGWIGTQIPGNVGLQGDNAELFTWDELPTLGIDSPPMFTYYHQGAAIGYYSALFTFPATRSAVVVLTNSMPLNDAADWIAQLAKEARRRKLSNVASMKSKLEDIKRHHPSTPRDLATYTGTYINDIRNFYIVVRQYPAEPDCLELLFQGRDMQVYELRHLRDDTFEWALDYDE
ncbi:hypothetical protein QQX98_011257 [Neonectria punicea]|uniref:Beta-lactamase-related domain-containing protein n=1 Tax=Neonectria punicea TaxID=979145 RepID=A0ABR1GM83_9HYPO